MYCEAPLRLCENSLPIVKNLRVEDENLFSNLIFSRLNKLVDSGNVN